MKKIVFFIILIVILLAVPISVYFVGQSQELRSRAAPATTLAFNPTSLTKKVGDTFSLDIQIDTGGNNVAIAELHITFDTTVLEATSFTTGPAAPLIAASEILGAGTASISVRAQSTAQPITGTGTIAVIRFRVKGVPATPVKIAFAPTTYVSGLGESNPNVLVSTIPATIQISGGNELGIVGASVPSVQPTLQPTIVPELSSTPSAESSPSAEASASAIQISVQKDESGVSPNTPLIQGKAPPGSTVTIVIHSDDPITVVVTVDENGDYHYTPSQALADGTHTVIVTSQSPDGTTDSSTAEFIVSDLEDADLTTDAMPTSGTLEYTIILVGVAMMFLVGGVMTQISRMRT
jgi:hypothetical protein